VREVVEWSILWTTDVCDMRYVMEGSCAVARGVDISIYILVAFSRMSTPRSQFCLH
jgi:hypothetical protein